MYLMKRVNYEMETMPDTLRLLSSTGELDKNRTVDIFTDSHPPLNERVETTNKQTVEVAYDFENTYEVELTRMQRTWRYIKSLFSSKQNQISPCIIIALSFQYS